MAIQSSNSVSSNSVRTISFDNRSIPSVNGEPLDSFEGQRIVSIRANACKAVTAFSLILIGSTKLGSLCFDDQDTGISGLTSRTYEAVNTALLIGFLTLQYTKQRGKLKNVFETGKICSYEFFATVIAAHMVSYSALFLASAATKDPLSAGIYGASLATVLASYAAVYKEHRAACEIEQQDAYHCIENSPSSMAVNTSQIEPRYSLVEKVNSNICLVAKASIPILWSVGSASFASFAFSDRNELTLRSYEVMSMGLVIALLAQQQMRPSSPLKSPLEAGSLRTYEFLATVVGANTVAYSLLFVANASSVDPLSAALHGGALSATLNSYASVFQEHVRASKDRELTRPFDSFFNYSYDPMRQYSVAIDDDVSLHSIGPNDGRGYIRSDSLRSADG